MKSPREYVADAVEVLDSIDPTWAERVDPERINMFSPADCIIGQAFTDGKPGSFLQFKHDHNIEALGLETATHDGVAFANFDGEWTAVVHERQASLAS